MPVLKQASIFIHQYVSSWASNQSQSKEWTCPHADHGIPQWPYNLSFRTQENSLWIFLDLLHNWVLPLYWPKLNDPTQDCIHWMFILTFLCSSSWEILLLFLAHCPIEYEQFFFLCIAGALTLWVVEYECCIVICWFMQKYTYIYWIYIYTMIKTQEDFFNKICTSHFIARVRKGPLRVLLWEGVRDRTETAIFWPRLLWSSTLCLSRSPDAQPEALGIGFLYCILSATSLVPKLHRGSRGPPRPGVAFPTTSHL